MATAEHFDAVIVGSGFGGSVMAYELATAGLRVCLLERGKAYPPGAFPRAPFAMARNFWDPSEGRYGMVDVWSFRHSQAIVSSALGGGSMIYANVLIRKPAEWFQERMPDGSIRRWPVSRADLDPHYDAVERILDAQQYPDDIPPYSTTPKMLALRDAARELNLTWYRPKLAVTFANAGQRPSPGEPIQEPFPNLHGRPRSTCRLCGECDVGCNYGSKNTLDYNYLTLAKRAGAELRCLCEVRAFRARPGGGYETSYVVHEPEQWQGRAHDTRALPVHTVTSDRLILSAGTFGSPYLLLKNRAHFPNISGKLGHYYSSNGDLLSFAFRCHERGAAGPVPRIIDPSFGTVITSTVEVLKGPNGEPDVGFYIQDAGYPAFVTWLAEATQVGGWIGRAVRFLWRRLTGRQTEIGGLLADLIGDAQFSATSTPLLAMGRDVGDGVFTLEDGNDGASMLQLSWQRATSAAYFDYLTSTARRIAEALGATFRQNPETQFLDRLITVHPVGGCPMGKDITEGVVDSFGQVFGYPGLYVADGSVMPGAVGPNPSLTIAALSRRFAQNIVAGRR
jgi:cholesterol oxidase